MANDEDIQDALLAIHSRLGAIEGKVNLVARAERAEILKILETTVRAQPLIGQIYLVLDGIRTQKDVLERLAVYGITPSQPTVSRRMSDMETEHGMIDLVQGGAAKVYRKDREMERVLNLSKNVRKWLEEEGQVIPEEPTRRRSTP
jgi:hypothetical protein